MRRFGVLVWLIALMASGCVTLHGRQDISEIDRLVTHQQYGRALDRLSHLDPKSPDYEELAQKRRHIESLAANYENTVHKQAVQDRQQGDWATALNRYDNALARLPKSTILRDGLAELHRQQTIELEKLERERLFEEATWLKNTRPTYQAIAQTNPRSRSARQEHERIEQQAARTAALLTQIGAHALANNDLTTARRTLLLAQELQESATTAENIARLHELQHQQSARQQQEHTRRQQRLEQHHADYLNARNNRDYVMARTHLQQIRILDPDNDKWNREQQALDTIVHAHTEHLFNQGINIYSRGQYEQAAELWRDVLQLDPDHQQARENLQRAERVLQRIEVLKQQQSGE